MAIGRYTSFESFGLVDGPGVRSVLFLAGCPYRCLYCHNPESWEMSAGKEITSEEAFRKLMRWRPYWGEGGGITVSGGEPLMQIDFLIELGKLCKKEGVSLAIDTSGAPFEDSPAYLEGFDALLGVSDLFLVDIKAVDPALHRRITGKGNESVLRMLRYLSDKGYPVWIRHVLVEGLTDDDERLKETADFIKTLNNVRKVEVLPYHTLGVAKYHSLGIPYPLEGTKPPSQERVRNAKRILGAEEDD